MADNEVRMMMSVLPGAMTGFAALNSGLVSINNVFGAMTRSIDAQFGLIDTAIMTTGVVVAQLGADAMNAFGQFEQGMKIVQMVSGQTGEDIDLLKQKANEFSVQYRMDIDQITEGLQTLGRAGLNSASEQAEVLENGLYTAKLEGRDLNSVLEELIQTTALLGGDLKSSNFGEDSGYIEDLMVATSMSAPITTHDVNETLKYSGGIAAAAGANIRDEEGNVNEEGKKILEDYMGSIAAFAQKGVTGSIAGTALRAFFNKPATQDSSVKEALATIKLKPEYLWEEDEQTMKPVSEQIALIQGQMDKLNISTMDRLQIWSKIVGGKMGQQMMKLESDDIKELTADIRAADNASSLATNSMKTYEANVKAVGESGALLQRNVGEKLVFFANPILDIINKVASFLNQDFMSWPIAIGIMSFIALAGKKAMSVLSSLKSEISTLYAGMKAQQQFFTQKQGIVRLGDNPIDDHKAKAKAWFEARDEYYGKKSSSGVQSSGEKTAKPIEKQSPQEFAKTFNKNVVQQTVGELRKSGWSDAEIAMKGRFSNLNATSFPETGMSDKQFADFIGRHHILTKEQQAHGMSLIQSTTASRGPFEEMFGKKGKMFPHIEEQIASNAAAMEELGWVIQEEVNPIEQNIQAHRNAIEIANEQAQKLNALIEEKQLNAQKEVEIEQTKQAEKQAEQQTGAQKEVEIEQTKQAEKQAEQQTGAQKEVEQERVKQTQILSEVTIGSQKIIEGVAIAMAELDAIARKNAVMPGTSLTALGYRYPYDKQGIPLTYSQNLSLLFGNQYGNVNEAIRKGYTPLTGQMPWFMTPFNTPRDLFKNGVFQFSGVTDADIRAAQAAMYHGGGIGFYGALNQLGMGNKTIDDINKEVVPNALKRGQEAIRNRQPPSPNVSQDTINNARNIAKNAVRNTVGDLGTVKYGYGEAELELHKQGLAAEEQILMARRQAAESASQNAYQRRVGTEKDRQNFQEEKTKGNLITSRKDIDDIRRQAKEDFNKNQRALSTEKDRQKFQEERTKGNLITSRKEINDIREEAEKNIKRNTLSLPNQYSNPMDSGEKQRFISKFNQERSNLLYKDSITKVPTGAHPEENPFKTYMAYGFNPKDYSEPTKKEGRRFGAAFAKNFSERLNRDRTGSFLSFGSTMGPNGMRSATKGLSGLANKALNLSDAFGGPLMIAIMAITTAIQMWQKAFQDYCEELKEAKNQLQESYEKWNSAEDALEQTYREGNPDATDDEIEQMVLDTYSTMNEDMANAFNEGAGEWFKKISTETAATEQTQYEYDEEKDDGSVKIKEEEELDDAVKYENAIKENTGALYAATAELSASMSKYVSKATDSWWGLDGWTGNLTNEFGKVADSFQYGAFKDFGSSPDDGPFGNNNGSRFTDNNEFLLTAQQKDENYPGNKEMAGLMLEDFKDGGGNYIKGLRTMMGDDVNSFVKIISKDANDFLTAEAKFAKGIGAANNARLQTSMSQDKKTWQSLGKEIAKYEMKNKKSIGTQKTSNKKLEGLVNKLNASMGGGFSRTQILQAAYLQQMQDMYEVAQSSIVPIIAQNAQTAANTFLQAKGIGQQVPGTGGNTYNTAAIASTIAALVSQIAMAKSAEAAHNAALLASPDDDINQDGYVNDADRKIYEIAQEADSGEEFLKLSNNLANNHDPLGMITFTGGSLQGLLQGQLPTVRYDAKDTISTSAMDYILENYGIAAKMTVYGYNSEDARTDIHKAIEEWRQNGASTKEIYESLAKNYQDPRFLQQIEAAYLQSGEDEGEGSGGGSGSGSGSDKDKDSGTRKERVDLVLCSKKEIPKLNVNLFKKPPTFTVLNKNFKVRDVKINTEDTPKAIMSSIKNAFIDVQKRSDPKIIQDEEAVYDPEGATDGNPLPSGTAKTKTDS